MPRRPEGHPIPPHDFCLSCRRGDATRFVSLAGDVEWLAAAFETLTDHDAGTAQGIAAEVWPLLVKDEWGRGHWFVRLCRHCADRASRRFSADRPAVYSSAKMKAGGYVGEPLRGIHQPGGGHVVLTGRSKAASLDSPAPAFQVVSIATWDAVGDAIEEQLAPDGEVAQRVKADGLTMCCHIREDGERSYYVTANPELIAEDGPTADGTAWLCDERKETP
jgi:hypothetical protein